MKARVVLPILALAALVGCSAPDAVPDFRYYRLAPAGAITPLAAPLLNKPLLVEAFRADGVHGERPILYANDPHSIKVSQYHYQLWNDPPPVLVQRRMQELLTAARVSTYVTDRLSARVEGYRLGGTIYRFERVLVEGRPAEAVLGVRLRLQADDEPMPLVERDELLRVPVRGASVEDAAIALSTAVDQVAQRLIDALKKRRPPT
ncbi:MAG: membrane integrity-associated transporter subunit PqiC [Xanthomonadales bacterium]|nr:hypothetical protein [Xanthomonadales bacterium]MCC6594538.1 membrane integrity-associated transporter subunit PqiC [Xanthomonadales bacterium]MCE7931816.1 hypothetical protein [Xanthomonadales bacterium PRO6]